MDAVDFNNLIEDSSVVTNEHSLVQALRLNTHAFGFDHFSYLLLVGRPRISISSYPTAWKKAYIKRSYHEVDPVIQTARFRTKLFAWSLDDYRDLAVPAQTEFLRHAATFGIHSGISIPVVAGHGKIALLTFVSANNTADVASIDPVRASVAATLVHAQIAFLRANVVDTTAPKLSHRQSTCLKWASEGKTMGEIADIIGISKQSVRFHLDEARDKLDAINLVQASSIAARHRLV